MPAASVAVAQKVLELSSATGTDSPEANAAVVPLAATELVHEALV